MHVEHSNYDKTQSVDCGFLQSMHALVMWKVQLSVGDGLGNYN